MKFRAPIPGMSLTREPGNAPWEQPPLYNTPEEALAFYFQKLEDETTLDDILFTLEQGFPLEILVDSMTSVGVMKGYHTIDVKLLISPVLHEHLRILAETLDIKIKEMAGPTKEEKIKERDKKRIAILLQKELGQPEAISPEVETQAQEAMAGNDQVQTPVAPEPFIKRKV